MQWSAALRTSLVAVAALTAMIAGAGALTLDLSAFAGALGSTLLVGEQETLDFPALGLEPGNYYQMLAEAQAVDAEEDALHGRDKRGDELPEELIDPQSRLEDKIK